MQARAGGNLVVRGQGPAGCWERARVRRHRQLGPGRGRRQARLEPHSPSSGSTFLPRAWTCRMPTRPCGRWGDGWRGGASRGWGVRVVEERWAGWRTLHSHLQRACECTRSTDTQTRGHQDPSSHRTSALGSGRRTARSANHSAAWHATWQQHAGPPPALTSTLGSGRCTMRSKRPGRVSAWSSAEGRLVAAITTTPVLSSNPSISGWWRAVGEAGEERGWGAHSGLGGRARQARTAPPCLPPPAPPAPPHPSAAG